MPVSEWVSPELQRAGLLALVCAGHYTWRQLVNLVVPVPYLDEIFHAPQAQTYWDGDWSQWDPKITTPPALYVFSYAVNSFRAFFYEDAFEHSTADLRLVNLILLYVLLVALYAWAAISRREINEQNVLQREFAIICFPLLFFFSGLYYTDIFSTLAVIITYNFWLAGTSAEGWPRLVYQCMHFTFGLISLASRQTNIFWVAVFLGGLQVVASLKETTRETGVHDPPIVDASFEDFAITAISICRHALPALPRLILELWPQISLFLSFGGFVFWNGGVVLGDKSNHIASVHTPQLLYFFALVVVLSWPVLLPQLRAIYSSTQEKLPRLTVFLGFTAVSLLVVHYNTLIHPFTLADNRHYPFYVFRYFVIPFPRKYFFAPLYVICGWLALAAFSPTTATPTARISTATEKANEKRTIVFQRADTVYVSFVIVFLVSTALSLVTAPLVEPRYFMIPWLVWRLHVPEVLESEVPKQKAIGDRKQQQRPGILNNWLTSLANYATAIELLWYMAINIVTGYLFLFRPFAWPQELGKWQRFMW